MTTEQKARAYDEAIGKAQDVFHTSEVIKITDLFPQLAESEDERIRRELLEYAKGEVRSYDNMVSGDYDSRDKEDKMMHEWWKKVLAWLEKQKDNPDRLTIVEKAKSEKQVVLLAESNGDENIYWDTKSEEDAVNLLEKGLKFFGKQKEQKPSTPKYRVGDVMRTKQESAEGITDGLPVIVSVDDNYYYCTNEKIPISEQEEYEFPPMNMRQKPVEIDELKIIKKHITEDSLSSDVNKRLKDCGWYVTDEKPMEWSEEDKLMLKYCSRALKFFKDFGENKWYPNYFDFDKIVYPEDVDNWLKSLPERIILQPKQEWSDEDEEALDMCLDAIPKKWKTKSDILLTKWLKDKLKSLRLHWKPSEGQLEALNALNLHGDLSYVGQQNQLISLYQDLKKLM